MEGKPMRRETPEYITEIARNLRKEQTEAENKLWQRIRDSKFIGHKFRRQYAIGRYIADFYSSKAKLVIEIDGKIHDDICRKEYDEIREKELKARELDILRFTNEQVLNDIKGVLNIIYQRISTPE